MFNYLYFYCFYQLIIQNVILYTGKTFLSFKIYINIYVACSPIIVGYCGNLNNMKPIINLENCKLTSFYYLF